jgi:serine/threonine protein kinase
MADERWQRLKSLCQQALECAPRDRDAFLAKACADNPDLLRDAKSLLLQATQGEGILDAPVWQHPVIGPDDRTGGDGVVRMPGAEPGGIGRYQNLQRIGRGAMGTVYRALDPAIGRTVAIKVLLVDDPELRARFQQEVRAAGTLTHQHIVSVYDYGESEGRPYIVMEYIDGRSLADVLRDRFPLTLAHRLRLVQQLCAALDYAHAHGVVHRDIKPGNVMLDQHGDLKVVDFGIAKLGEGQLTRAGNVLGTLAYMSPEQVEGGAVDRRSDIFSVGVVLYELVTSRRAFPGDTASSLIRAIINEQPVAPTALVPNLDPALDQIVTKALHKDPAQRYQTLGQMAVDLARVRIADSTVIPVEHAPTVLIPRRTADHPTASTVPPATQSEPIAPARVPSGKRGLVIAAACVIIAIGAGFWLARLMPITGRPPEPRTKSTGPSGPTIETTKQTVTPPATTNVVTPPVDDPPKKTAKTIETEKPRPIETTHKVEPVVHKPTAYEQAQALLSERPTPEQKSTAAGLLQKACDDKEYAACLQAGLLYHDDFILKNLPLAVQLYQRACDGGNAQACNYLGVEYQRGTAVAKDEARAATLYAQSCEGGVVPACTNLGRFYRDGRGVPKDEAKARTIFVKACDSGGMVACADGGVLLIRGIGGPRDPDHAVAMLRQACDSGSPPGCGTLAAAYTRGDGVDQSDSRAAELYQRACDAGGAPACNNLAGIYTSGSGVTKDLARAAALLQRSCDGSFADACQSLSKRYEQGTGVERNAARAADLARRATQLRSSQNSGQ